MTSSSLPIIITAAWTVVGLAVILCVPGLRKSAKKLCRQSAFLTVVGILGVAALSLNAAVGALQLHFKKLPVPMAVKSLGDPLEGIPRHLGSWVQVSHDEGIDGELEQVLGTRQYVFRDYVDTRVWPAADVEAMAAAPDNEREAKLVAMQSQKPDSVIRAAITYYTGMADTVAHIPERCMVADGFEPSAYETKSAKLGNASDGTGKEVSYRLIAFEDQSGRRRLARNVAYLFHVDGAYESDSLAVRRRLQSLSERYGYYAKLELMTTRPGDSGGATPGVQASTVDTIDGFLAVILPEFERCMPDWKALHEPPGKAAASSTQRP